MLANNISQGMRSIIAFLGAYADLERPLIPFSLYRVTESSATLLSTARLLTKNSGSLLIFECDRGRVEPA